MAAHKKHTRAPHRADRDQLFSGANRSDERDGHSNLAHSSKAVGLIGGLVTKQ